MTKPAYYELLLTHSDTIFESIGVYGKIETAKQLGMSAQAFSTFYPILVAYTTIMAKTKED